jgi:hypothetical protein
MKTTALFMVAVALGACQFGGRSDLTSTREGDRTLDECSAACGASRSASGTNDLGGGAGAGDGGVAGGDGVAGASTSDDGCVGVDEGRSCDDGDDCTVMDRCRNGVCAGVKNTPEPKLVAELATYGAEPEPRRWLEGTTAFVADDRLVFLESTGPDSSRLALVHLSPDNLKRIGETRSRVAYNTHRMPTPEWLEKANTRLVVVDDTHLAVVGSHLVLDAAGIEVFEVRSQGLVPRGFTELPLSKLGIIALGAVARSDALWICGILADGEAAVRSFRVDHNTWTYAQVGEFEVERCGGLALAPDGRTLFVAGNGVQRFGVAEPEQFVPLSPLLAGQLVEEVQVNEHYLAALTVQESGAFGEAVVMRADEFERADPSSLAVLPPRGSSALPFGMVLSEDRLVVEWLEANGGPRFLVSAHALDGADTPLLAEWTFREACCGGERSTLVSPAARGDWVVLQPWRRVLRLAAEAGTFSTVTGLQQGSMRSVISLSRSQTLTLGPYSSHRIDLAAPNAPRVVAGGMNLPPGTSDHQLVIPAASAAPELAETAAGPFDALAQNTEDALFTILDASQTPPTQVGSFFVKGLGARFGVGSGYLIHVLPEGSAAYRVRRYATLNGVGQEREFLNPEHDAVITDRWGAELAVRSSWGMGVAKSGDELLIVQARFSVGAGARRGYSLLWVRAAPDGLTVVADAFLDPAELSPGLARLDVALSGDQALIMGDRGLVLVKRDGSRITRVAFRGSDDALAGSYYQRILGFDAQRIFVARHRWTAEGGGAAKRSAWNTDVLRAQDLSPLATYETPDDVRSLGFAGANLVFGMNTGVAVTTPLCRP